MFLVWHTDTNIACEREIQMQWMNTIKPLDTYIIDSWRPIPWTRYASNMTDKKKKKKN